MLKVSVTQNQYDALVSLAYNIGTRALSTSTLMKKLNAGDVKGAADAFLSWNRSGGKVMAGLTNRRKAEREVFYRENGEPMNYLINRLKEPSTWRGIILVIAGVFGYQMPPGIQETVIAGGVALAGVVGAVMPDSVKK